MACTWNANLGTSGTGVRRSIASGSALVAGNFDYTLPNGLEVRTVKIKNLTNATALSASTRTFRWIVIEYTGSYVVRYVSSPFVHTGALNTEQTFALSPYYTVPLSGSFYSAFLYTNTAGSSAYFFSTTFPTGSSFYTNVFLYRDFPTTVPAVGSTLTFDLGDNLTDNWLLMTEEACDLVTSLTSVNMSSSSAIEAPVLTVTKQFTAENLTSSTACDASTNVVTIVLTSASLSAGSASGDPALTMEGQRVPAAMGAATAVTDATFVITRVLVPADMSVATLATASTFNHAFTLYPANLSVRAETQTVLNGSLENMRLSSKSSRTPDAGISLSWEESGVPKAYSWYDKTLYQFHLDFAQITEEECAWLQEFCRLHRYDEINYVWPFDGHTYRCILTNDVSETIIRSDAALGIRCTAAVDLLGYDIA
jgi:hypothetical protein